MKLKPILDNIVVEPEASMSQSGSIIIPETAKERPLKGKVIAAGPGKYEYGVFVEVKVKPDDTILYGKFAGHEVELEGKKLLIMKESDILIVL